MRAARSLLQTGKPTVPVDVKQNLDRISALIAEITANGESPILPCHAENTPSAYPQPSPYRYTRPRSIGTPRSGSRTEHLSRSTSSPPDTFASWRQDPHVAEPRRSHEPALMPSFQCPYCVTASVNGVNHLSPSGIDASKRSASLWRAAVESPWYTPAALQRHLNWAHPHLGTCPQDFKAFNDMVLDRVAWRIRGDTSESSSGMKPEPLLSLAEEESPPRVLRANGDALPVPFDFILLVDLANVVLDEGTSIVSLPYSAEAQQLFASAAVAVCAVHETFVPHTSPEADALFALSLMNAHSDFFPFYSVTALEAGDLASASFVSSLITRVTRPAAPDIDPDDEGFRSAVDLSAKEARITKARYTLAAPPARCPPIVLLTKDLHQRTCMTERVFRGQVFTPASGGLSRSTILETCRRALREAQ